MSTNTSQSAMKIGQSDKIFIKSDVGQIPVDAETACSVSSVINAMMKGNWKEADSRVIGEANFDGEAIRRLVDYIQTGTYTVLEEAKLLDLDLTQPGGDREEKGAINRVLLAHTMVYVIADYYNVLELKRRALMRFEKASGYGCYLYGFRDLIAQIYNNTMMEPDETLRNAVCKYAFKYLAHLQVLTGELATDPDCHGFTVDMLKRVLEREAGLKNNYETQWRKSVDAEKKLREDKDSLERDLLMETNGADILAEALRSIPSSCRDLNCPGMFPADLEITRKLGPDGKFKGDWDIRCAQCEVELEWERPGPFRSSLFYR